MAYFVLVPSRTGVSAQMRMVRITLAAMTRRQRVAWVALVLLLMFGAVLETVVFLLIVPLAQAVSSGSDVLTEPLGPIDFNVGTTALAVLIAVLIAMLTVDRLVSNWLQADLAIRVEEDTRVAMFDEYLGASWEIQSKEPPGRIQAISLYATARGDLLLILSNAGRFALNILVMVVAAFLVAPIGALGILGLGLVLYLGFRPLVTISRHLSERFVMRWTEHQEDLGELVAVGADMQVFHAEAGFRRRLMSSNHDALDAKRKTAIASGAVVPIYQAIGLCLAVLILGIASAGEFDVAVLGAVVLLLIRSISYGQALQGLVQRLAEFGPTIDALDTWHESYASGRRAPGTVVIDQVHNVVLENVTYAYDTDQPAVRDVSISLERGQHVGIVGPSGSGKSTLVQLLLELRTPQHGRLSVNGIELDTIDALSLRRRLTLVPQQAHTFRGTVAENIRFFRDDVGPDDIEQAARWAGLHSTILGLPQGYDTMIGASHRDLSGGQAQRLGIARALAGRPDVVVLDEPTSALDVDSESLVTETLRRLPDDVIVVIVAHRMTTLRDCDVVLVMEDGRIVASGPPGKVFETSDFYRRAVASGALSPD